MWGLSPEEVLMVGDSAKDDVVCGKTAGALTCLLDESDRYDVTTLPAEQCPDFKVKLFEVGDLLQERFELCP
ncbi:hypothetical protein O6H91_Y504900 [Diphasiastrum complanatum]|nr:hypothetical protein O6H91_Y504900 [Diphasiastrum complanatum]